MTTNAFIFSWNMYGIESIIPITQYEEFDALQTWEVLNGKKAETNPLNQILTALTLRARFNTHRHYEIYAIDCEEDIDEEYWQERWDSKPQECAELIRSRGIKIFSDRVGSERMVIV